MQAIRNIVILTGAGISAESGLRTFRAEDGLWEDHPVEEVATPEGFRRDPDLVQRFYDERRAGILAAQPNPAHAAMQNIALGLLKTFKERGIEFAYPTQTTFTAAPDGTMIMPYATHTVVKKG